MNNRVYMIDSENIHHAWLDLLTILNKKDQIYVMYSDAFRYVKMEDIRFISKYINQIKFIHCYNGTDSALDFQLSALLGYLSRLSKETEFIILSNDTGYDVMVQFMNQTLNRKVRRINSNGIEAFKQEYVKNEEKQKIIENKKKEIDDALMLETLSKAILPEEENEKLKHILEKSEVEIPDGAEAKIRGYIYESKNSLKYIHNKLRGLFGQRDGDKVYHYIKFYITDFYNALHPKLITTSI